MTNNVETALSYLSQIRKVYAERLNIKFREENFSPNEISVLILLSNNKSINTSSQLTTILGVSKSLVSGSLAALERKGLIQTREASGDRRSREIYLTASASAVTKQLSEGIKEINEVVLADISEEEMRMMKETMEKIIDRFKAASAKTAKGE